MLEHINICLSGGAKGADLMWGNVAKIAGHEVVHWIFDGYNTKNIPDYSILSKDKLSEADSHLVIANKSLKRSWPTRNGFINNLLRRNYYQIRWSDSVYAISSFTEDKSLLKISGGTAWACQLFVDRWIYSSADLSGCNLYLFDQSSNKWYSWKGVWNEIESPPPPSGVYAGIGTRELTDAGTAAIVKLYATCTD